MADRDTVLWRPVGGCAAHREHHGETGVAAARRWCAVGRGASLAVLMLVTLFGCASGNHMAPVDEVAADGGSVPVAPAVPVSGAVATPYEPTSSRGVQVRTLPPGGDAAAAQPLTGSALDEQPQGSVPAPVDRQVSALAPGAPATAPTPSPSTLSPAVAALVNDADARAKVGEHDRAAASLERALKVEPSNAWLWYRLARERLAQGRAAEAESLAGRSNSLASGDDRLMAGNWRVIEQARRQRGDDAGAKDAALRASGLETG